MSSLQNKLYNYEQTPPENTWEKIAAALDESNLADEFPSKLYNAEVTPPASAWGKIASSLDAEHPVVIPIPRKSFPLFRYAAAAAIIGIIAFGIIKWTGTNNSQSGTEELVVTKDSTPGNKETVLSNENNNIIVDNSPKENISTEKTNTNIANTDQVKTTRIKRARNKYAISDNIDATQPIYAYNEHTPNLADRYVMLMTPNGNIIRMSKKWGDLVCCVSGEEQDDDCKDQMKKWQEKLAASPGTSSGNFMDILSMVSSLNTDL